MKAGFFKKFFNVTLVFVFALGFLSCSIGDTWAGGTEDVITRSFDVSEGGALTMDVERASIEVDTQKGETVNVKVVLKAKTSSQSRAQEIFDDYKIDFKHTGSDVTIEADWKGGKGFFSGGNRIRVHFMVTVPVQYDLDLKTSGGSISVSDIEGEVEAKTSGGSLKFETVKGEVEGRTSGGSIKLEGCTGNADVKTSGGSIRIGKVHGEVKAYTSGGSISVDEVMGRINAHTSGGSISAYISKQPAGDCSLKTSGGSITAKLAEDIKVDVDAKTSGGRVKTDFPVTIRAGELSKTKLQAQINGGGPELYLRTSGGNIRIQEID
jgi:DUF4097 and DUF4098 domain-containing protein YvlB